MSHSHYYGTLDVKRHKSRRILGLKNNSPEKSTFKNSRFFTSPNSKQTLRFCAAKVQNKQKTGSRACSLKQKCQHPVFSSIFF